jgi:hypothetical protein
MRRQAAFTPPQRALGREMAPMLCSYSGDSLRLSARVGELQTRRISFVAGLAPRHAPRRSVLMGGTPLVSGETTAFTRRHRGITGGTPAQPWGSSTGPGTSVQAGCKANTLRLRNLGYENSEFLLLSCLGAYEFECRGTPAVSETEMHPWRGSTLCFPVLRGIGRLWLLLLRA